MSENKKIVETSDFLKKLQKAVTSGDPNNGLDAIKKINDIHKLANGMNGETASASFDKRVEDAGLKDILKPEERARISIESEKERLKIESEEEKLAMISKISNAEYEVGKIIDEFEEMIDRYEKMIEVQKGDVEILKIKFEAKYNEKYGGI